MYDINALEQQWKRYRRKRLLLPLVGVIVLLVAGTGGWYALRTSGVNDTNGSSANNVSASGETPTQTVTASSLSPVVPSMTRTADSNEHKMKIVFSDPNGEKAAEVPSKAKKVTIEVTSKESGNSVRDIESRFAFAKDKDDALFLARYYYDKKQYKKALKWALETNKLDSDIEESWLIFARSKARLGQRIEAIRVLQAYYDRSGSVKARKLLGQIRRGKAF